MSKRFLFLVLLPIIIFSTTHAEENTYYTKIVCFFKTNCEETTKTNTFMDWIQTKKFTMPAPTQPVQVVQVATPTQIIVFSEDQMIQTPVLIQNNLPGIKPITQTDIITQTIQANTNPDGIKVVNQDNGTLPLGNVNCGGAGSGSPRLICIGTATKFAHGGTSQACAADADDQQNNQRSASGVYLSKMGAKAIPAVALPRVVNKAVPYGTAVEVKDLATGNCKAFPILDSGPSNYILNKGVVIDLTGSAFDILQNKLPCSEVGNRVKPINGSLKVQYAVNVSGKKLQPGEVGECTMLK